MKTCYKLYQEHKLLGFIDYVYMGERSDVVIEHWTPNGCVVSLGKTHPHPRVT